LRVSVCFFCGQGVLDKAQFRRRRQCSDLGSQAVVEGKAVEAGRVEIIMDVLRQVDADGLEGQAEARRPLLRDDL